MDINTNLEIIAKQKMALESQARIIEELKKELVDIPPSEITREIIEIHIVDGNNVSKRERRSG